MRSLELFLLRPLPLSAQRAHYPALQRLLSRARITNNSSEPLEAAMLTKFGVQRQRDWPVAPFAVLGHGQHPGAGYWFCADPVHLQVDRDALVLVDAGRFDLDPTEATRLVEALNAHFGGLCFFSPTAKRWYVKLERPPQIETVPLREATGRNVEALLPRGADALAWHRTFNEIQMVLHAHGVNEAREARGEPAVNSVWFWGGGVLPGHVTTACTQAWTSEPLSAGLARAARIAANVLPRDFAHWLVSVQDGAHLIVLDVAFDYVDTAWITPALDALRARTVSALGLSISTGTEVHELQLARADLWKFWRSSARVSA